MQQYKNPHKKYVSLFFFLVLCLGLFLFRMCLRIRSLHSFFFAPTTRKTEFTSVLQRPREYPGKRKGKKPAFLRGVSWDNTSRIFRGREIFRLSTQLRFLIPFSGLLPPRPAQMQLGPPNKIIGRLLCDFKRVCEGWEERRIRKPGALLKGFYLLFSRISCRRLG